MKVKRLDKDMPMPVYAKKGDAGFDLRATEDVTIYPGETAMVGTGLAFEIPEGWNGEVRARSGMASKRMLAPINEPGTVDAGYRGEVMVPLHNYAPCSVFKTETFGNGQALSTRLVPNNNGIQHVKRGERIAQLQEVRRGVRATLPGAADMRWMFGGKARRVLGYPHVRL